MMTVSIGDRFADRSEPDVVWCVVGVVETDEGPNALLLATDSTRFCEVRLDRLIAGERFVRTAERDD